MVSDDSNSEMAVASKGCCEDIHAGFPHIPNNKFNAFHGLNREFSKLKNPVFLYQLSYK